jgi:hypothetical protein
MTTRARPLQHIHDEQRLGSSLAGSSLAAAVWRAATNRQLPLPLAGTTWLAGRLEFNNNKVFITTTTS